MTERKFTDEEVIKALECCSKDNVKDCDACPYEDMETKTYCVNELIKDALDLINRQKAEIDILIRKHDTLLDEIAEKQAQIERLREHCLNCGEKTTRTILMLQEILGTARAEAIREFAERFKDKYKKPFFYLGSYEQFMREVDDLVKEMTEEL